MVMDQIDQRTTELGSKVREHVGNLRSMGDTLRSQGMESTAGLVDKAAGRLDSIASYLTDTDGDRIVHDLEIFARNQALLTAATGLLGGMLAARLLKASATQRYRTYSQPETDYSGSSYGRADVYAG